MDNGMVISVDSMDVEGCPNNSLCLSEDKNFGGEYLPFPDCLTHQLSESRMSDGRQWNDQVSSIRNAHSGGQARFYNYHEDGVGYFVLALNAGHYLKDLSQDTSAEGGNANDKIDYVAQDDCQ